MNILKNFKPLVTATVLMLTVGSQAQSDKFKVVLDAGHGAKDFGAIHHNYAEKNIALAVTLKVGRLLDKQPNIDVIYTRSTDVFIELAERANIANKNNANLFVSIHCNANPSQEPFGTETYVMGLTKLKSNLQVAQAENQVVELEADYKLTYAGYDPKSPESIVGMKLQQEDNMMNSFAIASKIQDNFHQAKRKSRGVKQAPFLVLHRTAMPSILVEMGFISNKNEGAYLNSEDGQNEIAKAIADAISIYKKEYFGGVIVENKIDKEALKVEKPKEVVVPEIPKSETKPVVKTETKPEPVTEKPVAGGTIFKVQISASGTKLALTPSNFKGLNDISMTSEGNLYKYMYGETGSYDSAKALLQEAKSKGYTSAFLVAYKNGKKVSIQEALK